MTITDIPEKHIHHATLKEGSRIRVNGKEQRLGRSLGKGGEGEVFSLTQNTVAKIYFDSACTLRQKCKIELIVSLNIHDDEIAAPIAVVTDLRDNFCGYVMPKVSGRSLENLMSSPLPSEKWKNWNRQNLVEACYRIVSILKKIYSIQNHYILIGDLNLGNFMSPVPGKVILVDFDSVQIDEFPCPVGTEKFTPPEILQKRSSRRTILLQDYNEEFSVAVLLFHILCGIHPFSRRGGDTPKENILSGIFPYNVDGSVTDLAPIAGNAAFYWAFLPQYICEAFYNTFSTKDYESGRTSVIQWTSLFAKYLKDFSSIANKDPEANQIVLTRYPLWKAPKDTEECLACHEIKPKNQIEKRICIICQKKGYRLVKRTCKYCGKVEESAEIEKRSNRKRDDFVCVDCLKSEQLKCSICNNSFEIKHFEKQEYLHDGKVICSECLTKYDEIKNNIEKLQCISNPPPFVKINFTDTFNSVLDLARKYVPFLKLIGDSAALDLVGVLAKVTVQYQVQSLVFPKYQRLIKSEKLDIQDPHVLRKEIEKLTKISKEIEATAEEINIEGNVVRVPLPQLPYYILLRQSFENITNSFKKTLYEFVSNTIKPAKSILETSESITVPEKFFSLDLNSLLLRIKSEKKALSDYLDFPEIKQIYSGLEKCEAKLELGVALKKDTDIVFDCNVENLQDTDKRITAIMKMRVKISKFNQLGNVLCDFISRRLDEIEFGMRKAYEFLSSYESLKTVSFSEISNLLAKIISIKMPNYIHVSGATKIQSELDCILNFTDKFHRITLIENIEKQFGEMQNVLSDAANDIQFLSKYKFYEDINLLSQEITVKYNKFKEEEAEREKQKNLLIESYNSEIKLLSTKLLVAILGLVAFLYLLIICVINISDGIWDDQNYFVHFFIGLVIGGVVCVTLKKGRLSNLEKK